MQILVVSGHARRVINPKGQTVHCIGIHASQVPQPTQIFPDTFMFTRQFENLRFYKAVQYNFKLHPLL